MKLFCMKCGGENVYAKAADKPDECGKCGNAFATNLNKVKKPVVEEEEDGEVILPDFRISVSSMEEKPQTIQSIVNKNV